jgi:hypothetical protein
LSNLSEQEKIEIIRLGFQLQAIAKQYVALLREGKISLKKYYERVSEANSLFQVNEVNRIQYQVCEMDAFQIRRTKLYQSLKE